MELALEGGLEAIDMVATRGAETVAEVEGPAVAAAAAEDTADVTTRSIVKEQGAKILNKVATTAGSGLTTVAKGLSENPEKVMQAGLMGLMYVRTTNMLDNLSEHLQQFGEAGADSMHDTVEAVAATTERMKRDVEDKLHSEFVVPAVAAIVE